MNLKPLLLVLSSALAAFGAPVDFSQDVHPILVSGCARCHNGEKGQAGLSINTRAELLKGSANGSAIVAGSSTGSLRIQRITGSKMPQMPPGAPSLSAAEIAVLRSWIDEGAIKPRQSSIDEILNIHQPPVSDAFFVPRAYLDVRGLLPTPEQRNDVLANRENYVGPWISFWNDLLHNDEAVTCIGDRRTITPWLLIADLHATIYRSLGIPADLACEVEKRPFYVTKDGKGKAVMDLFA